MVTVCAKIFNIAFSIVGAFALKLIFLKIYKTIIKCIAINKVLCIWCFWLKICRIHFL